MAPVAPPQLNPLAATGTGQGLSELHGVVPDKPLVCCSRKAASVLATSIGWLNVSWMAVFGGTTPAGADEMTVGPGTVSVPSPVLKPEVTGVLRAIEPLPEEEIAPLPTVTWKLT